MAPKTGVSKPSIAVDAMGSDLGPSEVISGLKLALKQLPQGQENFILVGQEAVIKPLLRQEKIADHPRIGILHASEVVSMEDKPLRGLKTKKDSSMVRAIELVKEKKARVLVSCGNTGSLMAGGTLKLRTIPGITRPALGAVIPSESSHWVLIDAGANPNPNPEQMVANAILGKNYAKAALDIKEPRIGLLSIGTEEGKGTELVHQTHLLLRRLDPIINYLGPIEGFQVFNYTVDVVVCDGFVGNILLKSCESLFTTLSRFLKKELTANPIRMLGAGLSWGAFRSMKKQLSPHRYSGAPLLGLNGNILKAHGSSDRRAIAGALRIASEIIERDMDHMIRSDVEKSNALLKGPIAV
ncbi:MAG: phosphate acyltransferase PlsX [Opitutae bacterium]|nr:phosphate acyltransferase PlsX [Opitutae bacterium]MBC9890669.1 phosphate acyltransferase PlsX [Opitutae bacterium]